MLHIMKEEVSVQERKRLAYSDRIGQHTVGEQMCRRAKDEDSKEGIS